MRIAVIGGGPAGLYFSALAKQLDPRHEITVWERNAPDDTFGFGVVFSDETLGGIEHADTEIFRNMQREFAQWDDIDVHFRGSAWTSGGHGFAAMSRKRLLRVLQERCAALGVHTSHGTEAPDIGQLSAEHDVVLAADGANSAVRKRSADSFEPSLETHSCKYIWLGTERIFDAFVFDVRETPYGVMQLHGYPYSRDASTFIVEMHEDTWHRGGFDQLAPDALPPGVSDERSIEAVSELFADTLGGERVFANNSKWLNFTTVQCRNWRRGNVVLLGDAAHTAHFSIGSGTKLAMEDALSLAACLHEHPDVATALAEYERERRPVVASTQRAARASLEWFENIGQYVGQEPVQFAFNLLTRSRRVTYDNLRLRDPEFVAATDRWFAAEQAEHRADPAEDEAGPAEDEADPAEDEAGPAEDEAGPAEDEAGPAEDEAGPAEPGPPMFQPYRLGELRLANRVVVSAMDMYSAEDGVPTDFHLVHLGSKALGGAGLVMTEMVCVSRSGRISPGCACIGTPEEEARWGGIVDFVHRHSQARIGLQLGHSGRKGSTRLMWDGIDQPLPEDNWEVVGPSPVPYSPQNQVPRALTVEELGEIREQFVASAAAAARAGFDVLELHCAHGYLLSSFISPLSNQRTDRYGGSLDARLRFPLEVFDAVRQVWPRERPITVRISATDWYEGGIGADDAVEVARAFAEHGAAGIDVSTGQVLKDERPAYGRSYQTPYADRIRNEVGCKYGIAVIAVGAISSYDDVNSILLAGRADLCAVGRTHLFDPQWTLHAAADQGYSGPGAWWPPQFAAGSRKPQGGRAEEPRPRLQLIRDGDAGTAHRRWRPTDEM